MNLEMGLGIAREEKRHLNDSVNLVLTSASDNKSKGSACRQIVTRSEAILKGISWWLGTWAVVICAAFVPIVHLFAVPLLIILGPIFGISIYRLYNGAVDLIDGQGVCPDCQSRLTWDDCSEDWPIRFTCASCGAKISISPEPPQN